jgi:nicotinate-nucleotide pyrophosphorylase (carboxylating)
MKNRSSKEPNKLIFIKIKEFLKEDIGYADITSKTLIPSNQKAKAYLYFREPGISSGLEEAKTVFEILGCKVNQIKEDGIAVEPEETLLEITGPANLILSAERTALNIVGRMAGIATITDETKKKAMEINPKIKIAATRKTMPGLRNFDKKAVEHGGGDPHRFRLDDCVLIKDNHLKLIPSITEAINRVKKKISFTKKIEIEVQNCEDAVEAARAGVDIIMFDNMNPKEMKKCLTRLTQSGHRNNILYEASGGITPENIQEYAGSGVDIISLGYLTHSVRSLNVKLDVRMM